MKEYNELLEYMDEYIYTYEEEQIVIRYSSRAEAAQQAYKKGLQYAGNGTYAKWIYDIALDCVRKMPEKDREYVNKHLNTTEYHMGYAMYIRNQYIHPSVKHDCFDADGISSSIMRRIFSIVNPIYDFRNTHVLIFLMGLKYNV